MNLVVDVGNTFIKLAAFQASKCVEKWICEKPELEKKLENILQTYSEIGDILVSDVAKETIFGLKKLQDIRKIHFLSSELKLPFKNLYASPATLGNDRLALAAAASKYYPNKNVLVIDAGTCLTFDFLNCKNEFLGGAISPGLKMRYNALHNFTAKLPLLEPRSDVSLIGNSTETSIHSGVVNGMIEEIEGVISLYKIEYEDLTVVITGGDMHFLLERLKSSIFATSNFLLEGLNYILEINSNQ